MELDSNAFGRLLVPIGAANMYSNETFNAAVTLTCGPIALEATIQQLERARQIIMHGQSYSNERFDLQQSIADQLFRILK